MPIHHRLEIPSQMRGFQQKLDVGRLGVRRQAYRLPAMPLQKLPDSRHQRLLNRRADCLAIEPFLGRPVRAYFLVRQVTPKEIPHDFVVSPSVHALLHSLIRLNAEPPVVFRPHSAMNRIGIDDHPVHVQDQRKFTRQVRHPSSSDSFARHPPPAAQSLPARHRSAAFPPLLAGRQNVPAKT
jgi:hypothetical protein